MHCSLPWTGQEFAAPGTTRSRVFAAFMRTTRGGIGWSSPNPHFHSQSKPTGLIQLPVPMPKKFSCLARFALIVLVLVSFASIGLCQQLDPGLYSGLRWRMIGPHRGGRTVAVSGIESQPNVYYFGGVAGGVWKSANGG